MPNPITGDFDAVVQLAVRQIDGLLATLHQNGADSETPLRLLHSVRARVGEVKRRPPDVEAFGDWVLEYEAAQPAGPRPPVRDLLVEASPPGVARRIEDALADLEPVIAPPPPGVVRGTAELQLSTVRLSVADGSTSEVTVHVDVRARYEPDPETTPLPTFVHGEVRAVFEVRKEAIGHRTRLRIRPSPEDSKIEFIPAPGSGLTTIDASRIAAEVRRILREGMVLLPVDLPEGFPFAEFKGLGSGAGAAIALPLQLSDLPPPPAGAQGITQSIVGASGFAFAVSREYVEGLIDVEAIRESVRQRRITIRVRVFGYGGDVTYRLRFSSGPTLTFRPGAIEIAGRVAVETGTWWAPNGFVSFKQRVTLVLDPTSQRVDLVTVGGPDVDESWFIPHGRVVGIVKSEIAKALDDNGPAVRRVFQDARTSLVGALREFEPSASARYTGLEVSPHGVIVRGEISSAGRITPVVQIGETDRGRAFTALESWIPGGRIDRLTWSWVEYPMHRPSPWSGVGKSVTETDRFVLEKPPGIGEIGQVCLRVVGERVRPDGSVESVAAGTVCEVGEPVVAIDVPSWWEPMTVPVWMPDLPEDARLRDGIAVHVSVQTDRSRRGATQNALVFFPDWNSGAPFEALARGMESMRRPPAPALLVVVPAGAFDASRREFEERIAGLPASITGRMQVAEDTEGGWARTFDVEATPTLFLINARREFVWSAAGELDPAEIAAALDRHVVPAPAPRFRSLRPRVSVGNRAPDVVFRDDRGEEGAIHRFRGRPILLTFWQAWSEPSLAELRRLEALLRNDGERDAPFILAFHGGPAREDFDEIRKAHGITFPIVQDTGHRGARAFGVRCWPTTIAIDPDGRVEHIRLGMGSDLAPSPGTEEPLQAAT